MSRDIETRLKEMSPFSDLSADEVSRIAGEMTWKTIPRGTTVAVQGRTRIDEIQVVIEGSLKLYYEKDNEKYQVCFLGPGEIFGGISILKNGGVAVRSVEADTEVSALVMPRPRFEEIHEASEAFQEYFEKAFDKQMRDDSYASIIEENRAIRFLSDIVPFSFLPQEEIETAAAALTRAHYPKETVLFVQGRSRVDHLHIIERGAAERYFEEKGEKTLRGVISDGDLFGGISMLLHKGHAVRSLKTIESTYFYLLPRKHFLDLCERFDSFSEFFTDTFGKRMLDRSYAEIITKSLHPQEGNIQFFNRPVSSIYNTGIISCDTTISIQEAAAIMSRHRCSSIFVKSPSGKFVGIVTDNDLRRKVIAKGYDITQPVSDIMTSPLAGIPAQSPTFEAMMVMMQKNIKHLAVTDSDDRVVGIVSNRDMLTAQGQLPFFLLQEIEAADSRGEIMDKHDQLPGILQGLIKSGAQANNITRFVTSISDAILEKLIGFALAEMGEPPARFVFMILGSEGRQEQTLKTDQDNAIIYEDLPEAQQEAAHDYFLAFGEKVCTWLDQAGYDFCEGGVMAKNPKWCQPLSVWKKHFSSWIHAAEPEDLLQASIFFDFRGAYGDFSLIDDLRRFLFGSLVGWSGFFRHLTENALHFKPPLGFFRNFVVESKGEHRNKLDIKSAMTPIVDFARIHALQNSIEETNTMERLHQLYLKKVLSYKDYNELEQAYGFLMQIRFIRQVTAVLEENRPPDNYINPKSLSNIEQTMLKEIFRRIEKFQSKLNFDFIGIF